MKHLFVLSFVVLLGFGCAQSIPTGWQSVTEDQFGFTVLYNPSAYTVDLTSRDGISTLMRFDHTDFYLDAPEKSDEPSGGLESPGTVLVSVNTIGFGLVDVTDQYPNGLADVEKRVESLQESQSDLPAYNAGKIAGSQAFIQDHGVQIVEAFDVNQRKVEGWILQEGKVLQFIGSATWTDKNAEIEIDFQTMFDTLSFE